MTLIPAWIIITLSIWALIGAILWILLEHFNKLPGHNWNYRQKIYMVLIHGPGVWVFGVHKGMFAWLGRETKFEKAYRRIRE